MRVLLFDADGVLTIPEEMFTVFYAKSKGIDPEPFEEFFRTQWKDIRTGKKDLKASIEANPDLWQWDGTTDELVKYWCEKEDLRNDELVAVIKGLKEKGFSCNLATDQEAYRGNYIREVMFPGLFDEYFISYELGCDKSSPEFFPIVLDKLRSSHTGLKPEDVIFFDDSQAKVDSAAACGIDARLYTSVDQVRAILES